MSELLRQQLSHPEAIPYQIANVLLYPVLIVELALLAIVVFDAGLFSVELFRRWRRPRSFPVIQKTALDAKADLTAGKRAEAAARLATLTHGMWVESFGKTLVRNPDFDALTLMKRVADLEFDVSKRLERTRLMIRLGPILGLMTTLIPISPALVGLAKGDVQTLSDNLVIAFSTTVIGLLIGGLGYLITAVRDRLYAQDVSDVEYALELLEV